MCRRFRRQVPAQGRSPDDRAQQSQSAEPHEYRALQSDADRAGRDVGSELQHDTCRREIVGAARPGADCYRLGIGQDGAHYLRSFSLVARRFGRLRGGDLRQYASGKDPQGPKDINTRYVLEDVPFGFMPMLQLARISGASARLHECGVELLEACYGRDFAEENDILGQLGPLDSDRLRHLVVEGYPVGSSSEVEYLRVQKSTMFHVSFQWRSCLR